MTAAASTSSSANGTGGDGGVYTSSSLSSSSGWMRGSLGIGTSVLIRRLRSEWVVVGIPGGIGL